MNSFFSKHIVSHPLVLSSVVAAVLIAGASLWYYKSAITPPTNLPDTGTMTPAFVTTSGVVEPAQNPNLSFQSGGRVARVTVSVGQSVAAGSLLASLDTSVLSAQRQGALAALQVQQAKLDAIKAPVRDVDVNSKRTAVTTTQAALTTMYTTVPTSIRSAYDTSFSGISVYTDSLFSQPNSPVDPGLAFGTKDNTLANAASSGRLSANHELTVWQSEQSGLSTANPDDLDKALTTSIGHLQVLRSFADSLIGALNNAIPAGAYTSSVIATAQTSVSAYRDMINAQIAALQTAQKNISTDKLAIQSAQDTLDQALAGATSQDIAAQEAQVAVAEASLANINAQIGLATVVAPFSGTVGSVQVKVGDQVSPGTVAVALNPKSNLQVRTYVSEADAGRLKAGQAADITLDAYGSNRHFPATITTVDNSPTMQNGVPAYQVTLQFNQNDTAISSGMTANITINL